MNHPRKRQIGIILLLGSLLTTFQSMAFAQPGIEVQAIMGEPFGVGVVNLQLGPGDLPEPLGIEGVGLSEKNHRVLYPALRNPTVAKFLKQFLNEETPLTSGGPVRQEVGGILRGILNRPPRTTVYFLFRGSDPLELNIETRQTIPVTIQPRVSPGIHQRLMQEWWRDYSAPRRLLQQKPDYPPLVETYLVNTLARRLNLTLPKQRVEPSSFEQFEHELGTLTASESIRTSLLQERCLFSTTESQIANRPLPEDPAPPLEIVQPPKDPNGSQKQSGPKIEPIALRVPNDCFYIRFGSFANFLWFQDTLDTWGGDFANLVSQRGLNDRRNARLQTELVLEQTQLSRVLGGTVISDVAMIGSDMLFQDGAAIGFLFEARNNLILRSSLTGPRNDRINKGLAKEETVTIEGQGVSFLSSPDGTIRSYYAVSGNYHFVTSSKALLARFLQTEKGIGALGTEAEFLNARDVLAADRGDAVFAYFSYPFFCNITGPRYRTEMLRRLQSSTDIELLQLAKLNAATEDKPATTNADLVTGGFLPQGFGKRPDGSETVIGKGEIYDSQRGRRGAFVPVPDMPVDQITGEEETAFQQFRKYYTETWGRLEPMIVAVQRKDLPGKQQQITLDVRMTPLSQKRLEMLKKWAGPLDNKRLAEVPGNMASFEAILPNQRLIAGLRDVAPPAGLSFEANDGRFTPWLKLRNMVIGYLGYIGEPGPLAVLNALFLQGPDANGLSKSLIELYRMNFDPFVLYSFQPDVLSSVAPQLHFVETQPPAQLRVNIKDVTHAQITPFLNSWGYARTRETALGNVRLIHSLCEQLHVPAAEGREAAEFLLAAKLVNPLGNDYELQAVPGGTSQWTSTKLADFTPQERLLPAAPPGYVAPPLDWFRGLDLDASMVNNILSAHAVVIMQMPEAKPK